jgi:hypothetical protein
MNPKTAKGVSYLIELVKFYVLEAVAIVELQFLLSFLSHCPVEIFNSYMQKKEAQEAFVDEMKCIVRVQ